MASPERDLRRLRAARARGKARAEDPFAVVEARYDRRADAVRLLFRSGVSITIPLRFIPHPQDRPPSDLESISVSPAGEALLWTSIDADVYVPGLVERAFGHRLLPRQVRR